MWENFPDFGKLEKDMHESSKIFVEPVLRVASMQFPTQAYSCAHDTAGLS